MSLAKQVVPFPIELGLDTKFDDKQEEPGFLRRAENIVYETVKKIKKRNGYDNLSRDILGGSQILNATNLLKYKGELLAANDTTLYSRSTSREQWSEKGFLPAVQTSSSLIFKNAASQDQMDALVVDSYEVYAWEESDGTVRYTVKDTSDGSFLLSNELVAEGERPALGRIQNDVYIIYGDGEDVVYREFSILEPQSLSAPVVVSSDRDLTNGLICATSAPGAVVVSYNADNSGDNVTLFKIETGGTLSSVISLSSESASQALDVFVTQLSRIVLLFSDGVEYKYAVYPLNLNASLLAPTVIDSEPGLTASGIWNLTADVTLTTLVGGTDRNGDTVTLDVAPAAANPTNTILINVTGTEAAVTVQVVPNDGTNNGATPVDLTTAELATYIRTGVVAGKTITLTDSGSLLAAFTATGGDSTNLASGGEGDGAVATLTGGTIFPIVNATIIELSDTSYRTYYEVENVKSINNYIKKADINLAGSVTNKAVFKRSLGLGARAFQVSDNNYIPAIHNSVTQGTYFILNEEGQVLTKYANQLAGGNKGRGVLPQSTPIDDTKMLLGGLFKNRLRVQNQDGELQSFYSTTGVGSASIDFTPEFPFSYAELADVTHICAGLLRMYDGSSVTEHGFNLFPEEVVLDSTATTGGEMSDGNYGYVAVYRWTDNTGKDHRSAPTQAGLTVQLSGGGSTQTVTLEVPTLRVTAKESVAIDLYRTEAAGTIYYKVTDDLSPIMNDEDVDYVAITDTLSDAELISRELLYTTGNIFENIPAPAANQVCVYNGDRLAVIGDDESRVYFSKEKGDVDPVEFTDLVYRDLDPNGGVPNTIRAMSDKLVIFSSDAISYVSGDGPNNTGAEDSFNKPEIVSTDIGTISPYSVILSPNGLLFQSRKGIYLLTAGLTLQYVGARVEKFNGQQVRSAAIVGELNQVRFVLSEQRALVYNYNIDRWATFENHGGRSSVVIGNDYYYLRENGDVYRENRTSFSDASSSIKMRLETGWASLTPIQGYQRAYHIMLLCDYKSPHQIKVKIALDMINAWTQEVLINPEDFIEATAYGLDSPYGSGSPYGGNGALYQVRIDLETQKCSAIKLLIEDAQEQPGEGLSLSAITVRVGAKEGTNKLPAAQQYGAS